MLKNKLIRIIFFSLFFITNLNAQSGLGPCTIQGACPNTIELVSNGDFSQGNTGFQSNLIANCGNCAFGQAYCVGLTELALCPLWSNVAGGPYPSPDMDNYMSIDGSIMPNTVVWSQSVIMSNGNDHVFSLDVLPAVTGSVPPNFTISLVSGTGAIIQLLQIDPLSNGSDYVNGNQSWNSFCASYTHQDPSGNYTLTITQNNAGYGGYDYGIDNVSLLGSTFINSLNAEIVAPTVICSSDDLIVDGSNSESEEDYTWYISEADGAGNPLNNPLTSWIGSFSGEAGQFNFSNSVNFLEPGECYFIQLIVNNCLTSGEVETTIVCIDEELDVDLGGDIIRCADEVLTLIQLGEDLGVGFTYSWTTPTTTSSSPIISVTAPGNYCLTVTSPAGCVESDCIEVIDSPPIIAQGATFTSCPGELINIGPQVDIVGNYTYSFNGGPFGSNSTIWVTAPNSPLAISVYNVEVANADGCSVTVSIFVTVELQPIIQINPSIASCPGDDVLISATINVPSGLTWTDDLGQIIGTGNSVTVNPTIPTTYTVTSSGLCPASESITVVPLTSPIVANDTILLCSSDSPEIFYSNMFAEFLFGNITVQGIGPDAENALGTNFSNFPIVGLEFDPTGLTPGEYVVDICNNTFFNNCCTSVTFIVSESPQLTIPTTICLNVDEVQMHPAFYPVGITGIYYSGDLSGVNVLNNTFDPNIAGVGTHTFTACYVFSNGNLSCCETYTITVLSSPSATATDQIFCELDPPINIGFKYFSGTVVEPFINGFSPTALPWATNTSYFLPGAGITIPSGNFGFITFDPSSASLGMNEVSYVLTNPAGCSDTATAIFSVCPVPVVNISTSGGGCASFATLTATMTNMVPDNACDPSFAWTGPSITALATSSIVPTQPGVYTVVVTTAAGCSTLETYTVAPIITVNPIIVSNTNPCIGDPAISLSASASGGSGSLTYTWDLDGDGQFDNGTGQNILASSGFSGDYCVTVTDGSGCQVVECITITYHIPPTIIPLTNPTVCEGLPIVASADILVSCSSVTWQWFADGVLIPGATSSSYSNTLSTFAAGTVFSVEACCFGCCSEIDILTIEALPSNNLSLIPDINLCDWDGILIPLNGSTDIGTCFYSGPGVDNLMQTFDPIAAGGVGDYTINYTCTSGDNCTNIVSQIVSVTEVDSWHQSTHTTQGFESANDVVTDSQGNVYVVGTYRNSTFLDGGSNPDIQIVSNQDPTEPNAYIAKYDECANLLWVANTINAKDCEGISITLDEVHDVVYMGGNLLGHAMFTSSQSSGGLCTTGYTQSLFVLLSQGYVAQFDASTGCLNFAEQVSVDNTTKVSTLTVNESNGEIFVGGTYAELGASPIAFAGYVRKYTPITNLGSSNSLQSPVWNIRNSYSAYSSNSVNDLNFDETTNRIYMIGDFKKFLEQDNGTSTTGVLGSGAIVDAYVALYTDLPIPTAVQLYSSSVGAGNWMTGEGISIDPTSSKVYFTGNFNGSIANPFGFNSVGGAPIVGPGQFNGYMIGTNSSFSNVWTKTSVPASGTGAAYGRDVVAYGNRITFLGEFAQSDVNATGFVTVPLIGPLGNKVVAISYDDLGIPLWINATQSVSPTGADNHTGMAIENNRNGFSYIVGQYGKAMTYMTGNPASGDLFSSITGDNAYIMRVDESNSGAFRNSVYNFSENLELDENGISILAIPNPAYHNVKIEIVGADLLKTGSIQLIDAQGRTVYSSNMITNQISIDVSSFETGLYLIKLATQDVIKTERLIIK